MQKETVINIIRELLQKLGIEFEDVHTSEIAGHTLFTIRTKDSGVLIGTRGETLHAINHFVKKILEGKTEDETFRFVVDVNGYHLKHIKMLESQANMLAERARTFKYDIEMSPMSPYDRMIVHAALQGSPSIKTESQGEGQLRHIVIRYLGNAEATPESSGVISIE